MRLLPQIILPGVGDVGSGMFLLEENIVLAQVAVTDSEAPASEKAAWSG